jgi:predicted TIM-barrel enzyme
MAPPTDRKKIIQNLKQKVADDRPIIGGGAGKQLSFFASCQMPDHFSLRIIVNDQRYRSYS